MIDKRIIDGLWLAALSAFLFAGAHLVPFYPDEALYIRATRDYATVFIDHNPAPLGDIYDANGQFIDRDNRNRIMAGPVHIYMMGLAWHVAGLTADDLPDFWEWSETYEANVAAGRLPSQALLNVTRSISTTFLAGSVAIVFLFGYRLGGRPLAYFASALYTINPALLMHGRRALMEAPLIFFCLLCILVASSIVVRLARGESVPFWLWVTFTLVCGLAVATKHNALFILPALWLWIVLVVWQQSRRIFAHLSAIAVGTFAVLVVLSPVLWPNPIVRFQQSLNERLLTTDSQTTAAGDAALTTPFERLEKIIQRPYLIVEMWGHVPQEVDAYAASPLSGWAFPPLIGWLLTILAGFGLGVSIFRVLRTRLNIESLYMGLLVSFAAFFVMLMLNPLNWGRYYVPTVPLYTLFTTIGLQTLLSYLVGRARYAGASTKRTQLA